MPEIIFYESQEIEEKNISFVVIFAQYQKQWVFCKAFGRETWECAGGHVDEGENCLTAARRELYEETGAVKCCLAPVCAYSICGYDGVTDHHERSYGMLYYGEIKEFGELPDYEMEKILLTRELNLNWTYADIQEKLIEKVKDYLR